MPRRRKGSKAETEAFAAFFVVVAALVLSIVVAFAKLGPPLWRGIVWVWNQGRFEKAILITIALVLALGLGAQMMPHPVENTPAPAYQFTDTNDTFESPIPMVMPTRVPATRPASVGTHRTGAVCNDGTTSSATGSGACSHHKGVSYWLYS